jgi:hypothetical protein
MLIEPRKAAPGALLRWSTQALQLIGRGFSFWLGLILIFCLSIFATQRLPLVGGILALAAFFCSTLVAGALDQPRTASPDGVLGVLRLHGTRILLFAAMIACAGALVWMLLLARPGVSWWNVLYTERNLVSVLSADWFTALRQIFVYSGYALGIIYFALNIPGLTSFYQFASHTLLGLPVRDAYRASTSAQVKNFMPMLGIGLLFIVLPFLAVLLFPPAVPLLYCFLGALGYVSFREIFLGVPENQLLAPEISRVAAGAVRG